MGLNSFLDGVGDAVANVAKGTAWVANPTHWDDVAEGAGKAVEFVAENPGKTWDTAFEVGRAVVKDQLDPKNLAINAALIGATIATGGAAAPALAAKLGLGAKSATTAVSGLKAADTALDVAKGVKTGAKVLDTATDVAKVADTAVDTGRTLSRSQRFVQDLRNTADTFKNAGGMEKLDRGLSAGTEVRGAVRESLGLSRYGSVAQKRADWATSAAERGWGKGVTGKIAGAGNAAADPSLISGTAKMRYRYNRIRNAAEAPGQVEAGVAVAADPVGAAKEQAIKEMDRRGVGKSSGYEDRGQTVEGLYGDSNQTTTGEYQVASRTNRRGRTPQEKQDDLDELVTYAQSRQRTPFWEGQRSEWAGGIQANHDWRTVGPLRPISRDPFNFGALKTQSTVRQQGSDLNEQGAPVNFSPEIPASGMFAMSRGQTPQTGIDNSGQGFLNFDTTDPGIGKQADTWDVESKGLLPKGPTPPSVYDSADASSVYANPAYAPGRSRTQRRQPGMNPEKLGGTLF
jgi:hypothetical protein